VSTKLVVSAKLVVQLKAKLVVKLLAKLVAELLAELLQQLLQQMLMPLLLLMVTEHCWLCQSRSRFEYLQKHWSLHVMAKQTRMLRLQMVQLQAARWLH